MKKIFLTSAMCIAIATPSFATGISANAQSADCVNGTLGTYTGPASLSANWTANTINLNFYDGEDKLSSGTCTYDGGIELPNNPTKPGYEFDGWKVRRAAPSQPQQTLDCSIYNDTDEYDQIMATNECESHNECVIAYYGVSSSSECKNRVETQYTKCSDAQTAKECAAVTDETGEEPCEWSKYYGCSLAWCEAAITESWCAKHDVIYSNCEWLEGGGCVTD